MKYLFNAAGLRTVQKILRYGSLIVYILSITLRSGRLSKKMMRTGFDVAYYL